MSSKSLLTPIQYIFHLSAKRTASIAPACLGRSFASLAQRAAAISCSSKHHVPMCTSGSKRCWLWWQHYYHHRRRRRAVPPRRIFRKAKERKLWGESAPAHSYKDFAKCINPNCKHYTYSAVFYLTKLHILHHLMPGERRFPSMKILPF